MSVAPDLTDTPTAPPAPAPDGAADDAAWHARELAMLTELAEAGLEIARALKGRILEAAALETDADNAKACADLSRAFDRASRAVRLSLALRRQLAKAAAAPAAANVTAEPAPESRADRAERVRRIVGRVIKANYSKEFTREVMDRRVRERLQDRDITGDLEGRSIGELVDRICADLGLAPGWLDLSEEAWAQAEILERPPGSPYADWPDLPPEDIDPDDDFDDDDDPDEDGVKEGGGAESPRGSDP
jgi:hypothetical protein